MYIHNNVVLNSTYNEECFRQTLWRKPKHSFYIQFFPENHAIYVIIWKNVVEADRPQKTI